ncbi:Fanconi anemia group B protein [Nematostella vectensis]|uniref:Fanconi anemia group B protein n=1 Tax=Nematostella vectensis TaxID=45351 RepID=UPI002077113A|nr:Fanconi anemia group B protein [Nematostella vectensis]
MSTSVNDKLRFLAFKGAFILCEHVVRETDGNCVKISYFRYNAPGKTFSKSKERFISLGLPREARVRILRFEKVLERSTGLIQPALLVEHQSNSRTFNYSCFFLVNSLSFVDAGSFSQSYCLPAEVDICNGPTIFWIHKDTAHFGSSTRLEFKTATYKLGSYTKIKILWCGVIDNSFLAMGVGRNDSLNTIEWISIDSCTGVIEGDVYVPYAYAPVVKCCTVIDGGLTSTGGCSVVIGTSMGQLIEFNQGRLVNYCQLPFQDPCQITIVEVDCYLWFLVESDRKKACVACFHQKKTFPEWEDVRFGLVDDFLGAGTEQVLLVHHSSSDSDQPFLKSFTLTDLNGLTVSSAKEVRELSIESVSNSDALQQTVQALQCQLQACNAKVTELRMELKDKQAFICQTCKRLHQMTSPNLKTSGIVKSSGMICYLEGVTGKDQHDSSKSQLERPSVGSIWQRVLDDCWIVGLEIHNISKSVMSDVALSLVGCRPGYMVSNSKSLLGKTHSLLNLVDNSPIQNKEESVIPLLKKRRVDTTAQESVLPGKLEAGPTLPGKQKDGPMFLWKQEGKESLLPWKQKCGESLLPGQQADIVTVATLPQFTLGNRYACSVVLSWRYDFSELEGERDAMCCGYVTLMAEDVLNGKYGMHEETECTAAKRNWMAVKAVSLETSLVLSSNLTSLLHITTMLRGGLGLVSGAVSDCLRDSDQCLLYADNVSGPMKGVAMVISASRREAQVKLYTRTTSQVYLVLHRLRNILADDVTINLDS